MNRETGRGLLPRNFRPSRFLSFCNSRNHGSTVIYLFYLFVTPQNETLGNPKGPRDVHYALLRTGTLEILERNATEAMGPEACRALKREISAQIAMGRRDDAARNDETRARRLEDADVTANADVRS